ncbi:hypothetical protein LCGC14_2421840, partial [marine sediment metagenome]
MDLFGDQNLDMDTSAKADAP